MDFDKKIKYFQTEVDSYIDKLIPCEDQYIKLLLDSMRYSVFAGGKRLRPILMLAVGEVFDCLKTDLIPYAASMELIHTYSLIHDDLPSMDNDDYRRGKLTNHKVFGESIALLAGDALLNLAFENMLSFSLEKKDTKYTRAAYEIAHSSGIYGMVAGQAVDLLNEGNKISKETIEYMHKNKTGALINASVKAAAVISDASENNIEKLSDFANDLGLAFQIIDDILDETGDEKKLGKKTGSDKNNDKATYVSMFGIANSQDMAKLLSSRALLKLECFGEKAEFLTQLTKYLLNRDR